LPVAAAAATILLKLHETLKSELIIFLLPLAVLFCVCVWVCGEILNKIAIYSQTHTQQAAIAMAE